MFTSQKLICHCNRTSAAESAGERKERRSTAAGDSVPHAIQRLCWPRVDAVDTEMEFAQFLNSYFSYI